MDLEKKFEEVKGYIGQIEYLTHSIVLVDWDMRTNMPVKAGESRSKVLEYLSSQLFDMTTSTKVKTFIEELSPYKDNMSLVQRRILEELERNYNETMKIPADRYVASVGATSRAQIAWEKAKEENDYESFKPHLQKVIDFSREFIDYWGYEGDKYNTLLEKYERGLTVEKLDKVFGELRDGIVEILENIKKSKKTIDTNILKGNFDILKQKDLSLCILQKMGFDLEAGRLDVSVHPFTTNMGNKDVRLTTNYHKDEFTSALFSTIHEGGHGIYEQNISDDLENTGLNIGASMAIHESQSRFYENIVGRSEEFTTYLLNLSRKYFEDFNKISPEEFYEAMNKVEPSFIRTEADELTYSLHIIIRYELEKDLINGRISLDQLPSEWNKKYKEYLGVEPTNDTDGVLQDVHWSASLFGYFPSYALGNLYGAQIYNTLLNEKPEIMKEVGEGNLRNLHSWLKENVHKFGSLYTPSEIIKRVTGEELNSKYFINYLKEKYYKIYNINK
ncbi:Putative metalloprotease ypwA [uncultured Clostridium sp.]|uniref:carboxypeptidase M32 n=1 Tax=uncultured Clostridium sp. TaxID=59620 RepID=UPI000821C452|nr:carboxypeptidase M32 [uncultured Clostridium sp.]SCK04450.1 Putative metalloprotease ypwA [uncultured Clostridium sp.]